MRSSPHAVGATGWHEACYRLGDVLVLGLDLRNRPRSLEARHRIDVHAVLREKLGVTRAPYVILGACRPVLANAALECDPDVGLLLPCNVVVREESEGKVTVAFMDPNAVLQLAGPGLEELATEARVRLERVRDALRDTP
jgi:uncharacterized protein (DUF302 family)